MLDGSLIEQAEAFAQDLTALLHGTLPQAPLAIAELSGERVVVRPEANVALFVNGQQLATLDVHLHCRLDARGTWLAIEKSTFGLTARVDRTPVLRFDYLRDAVACPGAHIQVHAHRGALTHLLSQSGHPKPHEMSSLHMPVGGSRFRPCLEDVIQFLIDECQFDSVDGWKRAVEAGRADWRRKQVKAVVRDFHAEAAAALGDLGYTVEAPSSSAPETSPKALHAW